MLFEMVNFLMPLLTLLRCNFALSILLKPISETRTQTTPTKNDKQTPDILADKGRENRYKLKLKQQIFE